MHTRVKVAAALLAVAAVVWPATASPATAQVGPGPGGGGSNADGRFNAYAYYVAAGGRDSIDTRIPCTLPNAPAGSEAYLEWHTYPSQFPGHRTVTRACIGVLLHQKFLGDGIPVLEGWETDYIADPRTWDIGPGTIDDLIAYAVDQLDPQAPQITTDLKPDVNALVNLSVEFSLPDPLPSQGGEVIRDGPIAVSIEADPVDPAVAPIVWHTGDRLPACDAGSRQNACTHEYHRSSFDQHHQGLPDDHYRVAADMAYTGSYTVTFDGAPIGTQPIGTVTRSSVLPLAVDEAQTLNTPD
jgi:hypothetical protein